MEKRRILKPGDFTKDPHGLTTAEELTVGDGPIIDIKVSRERRPGEKIIVGKTATSGYVKVSYTYFCDRNPGTEENPGKINVMVFTPNREKLLTQGRARSITEFMEIVNQVDDLEN